MSPPDSRPSAPSARPASSSSVSDPNVFSDQYALEPLQTHQTSPFDADDDPSPTSSENSRPDAPVIGQSTGPDSTASPASMQSLRPRSSHPLSLRDAAPPAPNRTTSMASNAISDVHRASSTSSYLSMPRSQSPYRGATGPSHPYGMYPQITRTSSIASASTVRPAERPFVAPAGPEHPYAMYPQATVPEEEDDPSLTQANIALGFPGMGHQYQRNAQPRRDDIADIVGSDGHVEELPPYTRYADGPASKDHPPGVRATAVPTAIPPGIPASSPSSATRDTEIGIDPTTLVSGNPPSESCGSRSGSGSGSGKSSFKEKMKQKGQQRVCCGLPFWFLFAIIGVLLFGVIIGAIIGGIVGSKKGGSSTPSPDPVLTSIAPTATVTSTAFIDGSPLPTDHPIPEVPNGHYVIPTDNIGISSQGCIQDGDLASAWSCMPSIGIGVTIEGQGSDVTLKLDPYPLNTSFMYGAQPPDLHLEEFTLVPSIDRDSGDLGAALFAWTYYDKLMILQEQELASNGPYKRNAQSKFAVPGERPWFCWFNQTVLEFFIYVDQPLGSTATGTATGTAAAAAAVTTTTTTVQKSYPAAAFSKASSSLPATSSPPLPWSDTGGIPDGKKSFGPPSDFPESNPTGSNFKERRNWGQKRRDSTDPDGNYPLLVKIEEKRKPANNIRPSCRQMQVLDNGELGPPGNVISIPEDGSLGSSTSNRLGQRDSHSDLDHNCACEWMNW